MLSRLKSPTTALLALTFGHFVIDIQTSAIAVLIPLLRTQLGLDYAAAATIVMVQNMTGSVIQPLFGVMSDRRPLRQVLPVACVIGVMGAATALMMPTYGLVLLVVALTGIASAAYHATGALNANYISGNKKATGVSIFFAGGQIGYSIGPLFIVALMAVFGPRGTLGTAVPGVLGAAGLAALLPFYAGGQNWRASRPQARADQTAGGLTRRQRASGIGVIVLLISVRSIIQTGLVTFIPLYFASLNGGATERSAFLLSVFVFAGAMGTLFGGPLADRVNRKAMLAVTLGVVAPLLYLFFNTGDATGIVQVVAIALAGGVLISAAPLTVLMAQEMMPNNVGLASGLTLGLGFGAGGIGAVVLGEVADAAGLPVALHIITVLPILLIALSLLLPGKPARREATVPEAA